MKKIDTYMMATKAIHKLGDISSNIPDLCYVYEEHDDHYIGNWVTGYGFVHVKFPKETTRKLTQEEINKYSKKYIQIGNQPVYSLNHIKDVCK